MKRKSSGSSFQSRKRNKIVHKNPIAQVDTTGWGGPNPGVGAKNYYGKKSVRQQKKKAVKVSKQFKLKVAAATASEDCFGTVDLHSPGASQYATVNSQIVNVLDKRYVNSNWKFTTDVFLHWISCLWNSKTNAFPTAITARFGDAGVPQANNFDMDSLKFKVVDSSITYRFKNNNAATTMIRIYLVKPRAPGSFNPGTGAGTAYNVAADTYENVVGRTVSPPDVWGNSILDAAQSGLLVGGAFTPSINTMFLHPKKFPGFSSVFDMEEVDITLEPGQVSTYFVQGPSNLDIDMSKTIRGGQLMNVQKYSRYPMTVTTYGLTSGSEYQANAGYAAPSPDASNVGVQVSQFERFRFKMPDGTLVGIGGDLTRKNRKIVIQSPNGGADGLGFTTNFNTRSAVQPDNDVDAA